MLFYRFLIAALLICLSATGARAACAPFPTSTYLGTFTHAQIKAYVAEQQNGDWAPYLSLLQENVQRLRDLSMSGDGAVLRVKGTPTKLNTNQLTRFIYVSQQWLDVAECLSKEAAPQTALSIDDLNNFATAAGGDMTAAASTEPTQTTAPTAAEDSALLEPRSDDRLVSYLAAKAPQDEPQVANVSTMELSVRIETACDDGFTTFKITNNGATWPDTGMFSMFRLIGEGKQLISARRVTMKANDNRIFSVTPTQNRTGRVGISIEPSWYDRPFTMDAAATCGK